MLSYSEAGTGSRTALLIHGNYAGKSWWRELLTDPPENSRLIAPDMPGFGHSPVGASFRPSMSRYIGGLTGFLDDLGVERPVLVGHSFGGAVAVEMALAAPDRFPAMLLLSPAPLTGLHTPGFIYPLLESYRYDRRGLRRALRRIMRTNVPPYLDDLVTEARMMHPANFSGNARLLSNWSLNGESRLYTNPVLVASGNRDTLVSPSSAKATARAFSAGSYLSLGNVGHSPQIEAPDLVRKLLDGILG